MLRMVSMVLNEAERVNVLLSTQHAQTASTSKPHSPAVSTSGLTLQIALALLTAAYCVMNPDYITHNYPAPTPKTRVTQPHRNDMGVVKWSVAPLQRWYTLVRWLRQHQMILC